MGSLGFTEEYSAILILIRDARDANISHVDVVTRVLLFFSETAQFNEMGYIGRFLFDQNMHICVPDIVPRLAEQSHHGAYGPHPKRGHRKNRGPVTSQLSDAGLKSSMILEVSVFFGGSPKDKSSYRIILVGGLEHFLFSIIYGIILPNWLIFFRGVETTNQIDLLWFVSLFLYLSHLAMLIPGWNILWLVIPKMLFQEFQVFILHWQAFLIFCGFWMGISWGWSI